MAGSVYPNCICPDTQCPRHGLCAVCHTFHSAAGTLPKCERQQTKDGLDIVNQMANDQGVPAVYLGRPDAVNKAQPSLERKDPEETVSE